jgi:hypothetical protein
MLISLLRSALLLPRRLLPGVSGYIAAEKKKVSSRLMAVALHIFLHAGKKERKIQTFPPLLTCTNRDAFAFSVPPYQKSNYPPCLAADSSSRGNWISTGR